MNQSHFIMAVLQSSPIICLFDARLFIFRMVGGVLVERTVKEVIPALVNNRDKMSKLIETLDKQLTEKGEEINGYMEKHNIQIKDQPGSAKKEEKVDSDAKSGGVLVSN